MRAFVVDYNAAIMLFPHYKHVKEKNRHVQTTLLFRNNEDVRCQSSVIKYDMSKYICIISLSFTKCKFVSRIHRFTSPLSRRFLQALFTLSKNSIVFCFQLYLSLVTLWRRQDICTFYITCIEMNWKLHLSSFSKHCFFAE